MLVGDASVLERDEHSHEPIQAEGQEGGEVKAGHHVEGKSQTPAERGVHVIVWLPLTNKLFPLLV